MTCLTSFNFQIRQGISHCGVDPAVSISERINPGGAVEYWCEVKWGAVKWSDLITPIYSCWIAITNGWLILAVQVIFLLQSARWTCIETIWWQWHQVSVNCSSECKLWDTAIYSQIQTNSNWRSPLAFRHNCKQWQHIDSKWQKVWQKSQISNGAGSSCSVMWSIWRVKGWYMVQHC